MIYIQTASNQEKNVKLLVVDRRHCTAEFMFPGRQNITILLEREYARYNASREGINRQKTAHLQDSITVLLAG